MEGLLRSPIATQGRSYKTAPVP
ncbi:hypothetical protein IAE39_005514 [Pseudomonas sp. S37]|nr:hypothetical protein [Pseudomonas sp. S37]